MKLQDFINVRAVCTLARYQSDASRLST